MKTRENKGKNIVAFPDEYVCVDIETTGLDYEYDEIIEIGAARVKDGKIVSDFSSLVRPKSSHVLITGEVLKSLKIENFSDLTEEISKEFCSSHLIPQYIEELTGITNESLLLAPLESEVLPKFSAFVGDTVIVGHNVNFDVNFLYDACSRNNIVFNSDYIDTMRISRKLYKELKHHRLIDIVNRTGIAQIPEHRALKDVMSTVACYEAMKAEILKTEALDDFASNFFYSKQEAYKNRLASTSPTVDEIDETNPVFGKVVVFTGALSCMSRKEAYQVVVNLGGTPENGITKKTNFLVVGNEEFAKSVKNGKTNKMEKAEKYRNEGLDISVLSENTFFEMIQ